MSGRIRETAERCLGLVGTVSLRQHVMGVMADDNPRNRSTLAQMRRIQNRRFIRIGLVTIETATPLIQRDLDNANDVFDSQADVWVYPVFSITEDEPELLNLTQDDCLAGSSHSVSNEEDDLFNLGRDQGADVVCYYINGNGTGAFGCASHPSDRRGYWCGAGASRWTFAHELGHVVGDLRHTSSSNRLMFSGGTNNITNPPPNLTNDEADDVRGDDAVERCEVIHVT